MNLPVASAAATARPQLGLGQVRHQRLRPTLHGFAYPTWFLLLPMRALRRQPCPLLHRNQRAWFSFQDADHGDGGPDSLAWLEGLLQQHGVADADGEVWLHTYPRLLGVAFKPVSFWYCHRADGSLAAVVAEVNNTFGGRHCYLLDGPQLGFGRELRADKVLHVSPFNRIEGGYRFRFMRTAGANPGADRGAGRSAADGAGRSAAEGAGRMAADGAGRMSAEGAGRTVARIDYHDDQGPLLITSVSGDLAELTPARLRQALVRMPLLTLGVVLRIHWQALRLAIKRVPFFGRQGHVPGDVSVHPR